MEPWRKMLHLMFEMGVSRILAKLARSRHGQGPETEDWRRFSFPWRMSCHYILWLTWSQILRPHDTSFCFLVPTWVGTSSNGEGLVARGLRLQMTKGQWPPIEKGHWLEI